MTNTQSYPQMHVGKRATSDAEPTLNDYDVLEFCKNGFFLLENVIDESINQRTMEFSKEHQELEPPELVTADWFVDGVFKNPQVSGAVRSLLGKKFTLPHMVSNHRSETPLPSQEWHNDSNAKFGPQVNYLQLFYLPQECTREMGPTELIPGSHFLFGHRDSMHTLGKVKGSFYAIAPAGSILITHYSIWHRRSESSIVSTRNNLKFSFWRTSPPTRDWIASPDFDPLTADYSLRPPVTKDGNFVGSSSVPTYRQSGRDSVNASEMFLWLCGEHEKFDWVGGPGSWPTLGRIKSDSSSAPNMM